MELEDYLKQNGISIVKMADMIGYDGNYLVQIVGKRKKPGAKLAKAIQKFTNNEVRANDLLSAKIVTVKDEKEMFEKWKKERTTTEIM